MINNLANMTSQVLRGGISNLDIEILDLILIEWFIEQLSKQSSEAGTIFHIEQNCS